jgi:hypothetical protein
MSNVAPKKLEVVVVKDELMDWVEPVYTINAPSSLKSFNAQDIQTYSNSYINATLNLNSSEFVVDPAILHDQPVTITITGSSSLGNPLLLDGCFALRSNALYKMCNTIELKLGSTSNTTNVGDVLSACERYNNFTTEKFLNSFGLSYLDQSQSYNDLIGAPKNPLGLYSTGSDMIEARGAYPITIVSNTSSSAVIQTTLRQLVPISPLVDKIRRDGSPVQGLSHLNNLSFNITFYANAGNRVLSLADVRPNNDVLTLTNVQVTIGQPVFSFVQLKSRNESIPKVLAYPLVSQERYIFTLPAIAQNATYQYNLSSFNLSRVPQSMLVYARASNNALLNTVNGVFLPDTFAKLSNIVIQYDGQQLMGQSIPENYYQISMNNGLQDSWTQFSGLPIVKSATNQTYINGVGSCIKFDFGKDISLYPGIVVGSYNECSIGMQVSITNISPYSALAQSGGMELYLVMLYSDVIELYDNNLAQISNIPVSASDIANSKSAEHVHRTVMKGADITGTGIMSSLGNILKSPKLHGVVKSMKQAFSSPAGHAVRNAVKSHLRTMGHPKIANALHAVGFGDEGMDGGRRHRRGSSRGHSMRGRGMEDYDGGAYAGMDALESSLYE